MSKARKGGQLTQNYQVTIPGRLTQSMKAEQTMLGQQTIKMKGEQTLLGQQTITMEGEQTMIGQLCTVIRREQTMVTVFIGIDKVVTMVIFVGSYMKRLLNADIKKTVSGNPHANFSTTISLFWIRAEEE